MTVTKKELPKRKQVRDWAKQHQIKNLRALSKKERDSLLVKHHNELLARFYGVKVFDSSVANKVDQQLSEQRLGIYK